jgi:DNA-binding response OmpR family regulator
MKTNFRAIVFEDNEALASELQKNLGELGYDCSCIGDLGAAVPKANVGKYDIAIVDVNFCDEMAYTLLDILKLRHIDIILAKGRSRCMVRPPYDQEITIREPFNVNALRAAIQALSLSRRTLITP